MRTEASIARGIKETARRERVNEAIAARSVFITNLSFKTTEKELRDFLGPCGEIRELHMSKDKVTSRALGYAHVKFDSPMSAEASLVRCDRKELNDRVIFVVLAKKGGERLQFELPQEIIDDIKALMQEAYEGKNLSTIKDAWRKRHDGKQLDTSRWGFKNFSTAVKSIAGVVLETHLDKSLTNLPFFEGSPAHIAYREQRVVKEREDAEKKAAAEEATRNGEQTSANAGAEGSAASALPAVRRRIRKKTKPPCSGYGIS